jgi:hypothetical protein
LPDASEPRQTFIDLVLAGQIAATSIDDFVEEWHHSPAGGRAGTIELHEYLGLTWDEYSLWVEQPESLRSLTVASSLEIQSSMEP